MPAVPPKLPSIWNGGWVSKRFGQGVARQAPRRACLWAWSPSSRRAQKLIFHALLQPVPPSPRKISDCRAAANSFGVRGRDLRARDRGPTGARRGGARSSGRPCPPATPGAGRACRSGSARSARAASVELAPRSRASTPRISAASSGVGEQGADDLVVHRRPGHQPALLGRVRRRADQPAGLRVLTRKSTKKSARLLHHRVGALRQEIAVAGEQVVLPEVLAEPGAAGGPDAVVRVVDRRRAAPEVGVVVQHPAARAVVGPRPSCGRLADQLVDQVEQRLVALGRGSSTSAGQ